MPSQDPETRMTIAFGRLEQLLAVKRSTDPRPAHGHKVYKWLASVVRNLTTDGETTTEYLRNHPETAQRLAVTLGELPLVVEEMTRMNAHAARLVLGSLPDDLHLGRAISAFDGLMKSRGEGSTPRNASDGLREMATALMDDPERTAAFIREKPESAKRVMQMFAELPLVRQMLSQDPESAEVLFGALRSLGYESPGMPVGGMLRAEDSVLPSEVIKPGRSL